MAEEKKGKGLFRQISEVLIVDVAKKVGGFLIIVGIILKIADVIIPKIGFDLPLGMGHVALPQTNFFDQYVGTLSEITMSLLVGALAAFFWPVVIVVSLVLIWKFLNWAPVKDEPVIRQRMMNALFRGVHAGARKGGGLTVKGVKHGAAQIKRRREEAEAQRQAAMLAALDEESFPIEESGLDGLEALDEELPAFPPPPETLRRKKPGVPLPRGKRLVFSIKRKRGG